MITRELWEVHHPEAAIGYVSTLHYVRLWISDRKAQANPIRDPALYSIAPVLTCHCCGRHGADVIEAEACVLRCERHAGRNPCIIEGCGRTFDNKGNYRVQFVCGKHFRLARADLRRAIKRIEKLAKKHGWKLVLRRRHGQLWERCMKSIHAALAGDIDMGEINRLMGW